ncbi:Zn-dependent hydrolase, glyoxylase [Methanolobus tindarius DSM 2278]|uniref:Zn-dependent hydrolase, glyoxylase n=1 Tax=Methanolobus tindarius DSM 2278 TaxID=1090322 RepID=W9DV70_METTI|nr:MBL fold metallo-hydrolase [Methanolobus tindarius]ETA67542.1 Zn-dependent hydrolase, glyoxylase [Methanolobus tindarius DSM 2278]
MLIQQIFTEKIAHSSYILAGDKTCAIIDPRRDIDIYINITRELGIKITHILETHLHADFISGHIDLSKRTGAPIYAPEKAKCDFKHIPLSEGDSIEIEDIKLDIVETPGHTPEHISYIVTDTTRGKEPVAVFCGDTMFVGDVGRAMASKRSSTMGYEKKFNYALLIDDRPEFIESLTNNMPSAPDHFSRCTEINRIGPELLKRLKIPEALNNVEFKNKMENALVLDVRSFESFGGQHIPNSYNIDINSNFPTYAGWLIPPEKNIILVSDNYTQAFDACQQLHRVGLDKIQGYLEEGMYGWVTEGFNAKHVPQISAPELNERIHRGEKMIIVDVRERSEYDDFHIEGAVNIPVHELRERYTELNPEAETVLICGSGQRSGMGCSLLLRHGFKNVMNAAGGMTGYAAAGFGKECPMCVLPWAPFRNK